MNIGDSEALLAGLLAPHVDKARTYAAAGYALYGVQLRLGEHVVHVRLTRTSGPAGGTDDQTPREGKDLPETAPPTPELAGSVERLIQRVLDVGQPEGYMWSMTYLDRASERAKAKPASGTSAGVVVHMDDGVEFYCDINI